MSATNASVQETTKPVVPKVPAAKKQTTAAAVPAKVPAKKADAPVMQEVSSLPAWPASVPIDKLKEGRKNLSRPMQESDESIKLFSVVLKKDGIYEPLVVAPPNKQGVYEVMAGNRRLKAARLAGITEVPITVRPDIDPADAVAVGKLNLGENLHRKNLTDVEKGLAFVQFRDLNGWTDDPSPWVKVAKALHMSSTTVRDLASLVTGDKKLPPAILKEAHENAARTDALFSIQDFCARLPKDVREKAMGILYEKSKDVQKKEDEKKAAVITKGAAKGTARAASPKPTVRKMAVPKKTVVKKKAVEVAKEKLAAEMPEAGAALAEEKAVAKEKPRKWDEFEGILDVLKGINEFTDAFYTDMTNWKAGKINSETLVNALAETHLHVPAE